MLKSRWANGIRWNYIVWGKRTVHVVNRVTVMVNEDICSCDNGSIHPLTSGRLQLQSEGAELFIKEISIEPITEIPKTVL